jgi:hypothetical protein
MSHSRMSRTQLKRGVHKSTGGILPTIPAPVDPVDAAPKLDSEHSRSLKERGDESEGAPGVRSLTK